jgi:hypothetical protein
MRGAAVQTGAASGLGEAGAAAVLRHRLHQLQAALERLVRTPLFHTMRILREACFNLQ